MGDFSVPHRRAEDGTFALSYCGLELTLIDCPVKRAGFRSFFGVWLVRDAARDVRFLVDCGPAVAFPRIMEAVERHSDGRLDALLLTHIHTDHCGSAGSLVRAFPGLRVIAPAKGAPHLVDPSRLMAASRSVLGDLVDAYGEQLPVPGANIAAAESMEGLLVIPAPGHAAHHDAYAYRSKGGVALFPGEAAGVHLMSSVPDAPDAAGSDLPDGSAATPYLRPATPPRFLPPVALASLDRLRETGATLLCYPHFGVSADPSLLDEARAQLLLWLDVCKRRLAEDPGAADDPIGRLLPFLLEEDPHLKAYSRLAPDIRERENFFIANSLRGMTGWILEEAAERKGR